MGHKNKNVVNFNQKLKLIETHWSPKIVASLNDYHFKLVKVKGDFIWHNHQKCQWAGIYFVEVPDNKYTEFFDLHTQEIFQPNVREGDIIIFPSYLNHTVPAGKYKSYRVTIAINLDILL